MTGTRAGLGRAERGGTVEGVREREESAGEFANFVT